MPSHAWTQRTLGLVIALVISLGIAVRGQALQTEAPTTGMLGDAVSTVVPPSVVPPSVVPPSVVPPTEIPTAVPPTDVPTIAPTEQPTEAPTELPTEQPTEAPTEEPAPTDVPATPATDGQDDQAAQPPPAPTRSPQVREAEVTCRQPGVGGSTPVSTPVTMAETGDWTLLECTIGIDASGMEQIQVRGTSSSPGWRVILVDREAPNTPGLLDASNNLVTYEPGPESRSVQFLLGYQRSCTGLPSTRLTFEIVGHAGGSQQMRATATLTLDEDASPLPEVAIDAVWVDTERDPAPTSIRLTWTGAPETCSWTLVTTLVDGGEAGWILVRVDGPDGVRGAISGNTVSVTVPPGEETGNAIVLTLILTGDGDPTISTLQVEAFTWP